MKTQLQLRYPAWEMSFSEYGEMKGYDLSQTEATCDRFDHLEVGEQFVDNDGWHSVGTCRVFDGEDAEEWQRRSEEQGAV